MNVTLDNLLPRLKGVRALGNSKFLACCPAHPDSTPSLSVTDNGQSFVILSRRLWLSRHLKGCGLRTGNTRLVAAYM
jgi:hypothetical protein